MHLTNRIGAEGLVRHFCLTCADESDPQARAQERGLRQGSIFIVVGGFAFLFSLFADDLGMGRTRGLGWPQGVALVLGVLLAGAGALIRASVLLAIGGVVTAVGILAMWMCLGNGDGFGCKQISGVVLGLVMMLGGLAWTRWKR